jgi:hypothetical protein
LIFGLARVIGRSCSTASADHRFDESILLLYRAQEMAAEFPHCDITSVDIAPITPHVPRANITFEIYDLYAGVAEPDESFDYVSCRHTQLHVSYFLCEK